MTYRSGTPRRRFLQASAATGVLGLVGCAAPGAKTAAKTSGNPNALRLGVGGGGTKDSLDPRTFVDSFCIVVGYQVMNGLVEIDENRRVTPELIESWEAKPGAAEWVLNVRKGVTFHNGKTLDADDVIYSINLHRQSSTSGAALAAKAITDIRKLDANQIAITLGEGNADFPYALADYHFLVVPDGFSDWSHPIGTGGFTFESFDPGSSATTVRNPNYWKAGRARVEAVESRVINSAPARISAFAAGEVDIINRVDTGRIALVQAVPGAGIVRGAGGYHALFAMQVDKAPFDKVEVRRALKAGLDRQAMLQLLFNGFGRIANDHPVPDGDPFCNTELPQTTYDPDKAKFHLKQAGMDSLGVTLQASEAAFNGATAFAAAYAAEARRAGMKIDVVHASTNTFWDNVWLHEPFVASYWGGRPAESQRLEVPYASGGPWNETHWRNTHFDDLLKTAKTELDEPKRKQAIWEMQAMLHDDGGAIIPAFKDWVDAHSQRVKGHIPHAVFDLDNGRIAEKVWLEG